MGWLEIGASVVGNLMGANASQKASKRAHQFNMAQLQFQKDMAFNQIQWRTADAQKAGIHPLFALGASPMNYSPISYDGGTGGGEYYSQMGQDISRAIGARMTQRERAEEAARLAADQAVQRKRDDVLFDLEVQQRQANLESQGIENTYRKWQIANLASPGTPPAMPDVGGGGPGGVYNVGSGAMQVNPARSTSSATGNDAREAGEIRDYGFTRTDLGGLRVVPSYDVHERIEDNFLQQMGWALSNQVVPFIEGLNPPSTKDHPLPSWAPRGAVWRWSPLHQQFLPWVRTRSGGTFVTRPRRSE